MAGSLVACVVDGGRGEGTGPTVIDVTDDEDSGSEGSDETGTETTDAMGDATESDPDTSTGDPTDSGETGGEALECPTLGAWSGSAEFATGDDHSHPLPSFAVGDWYYVHTIVGGNRVLLSATPGPDGALGPWQEASGDHGGGPHGFTAIAVGDTAFHFRNGHIAEYPLDGQGHMLGDVVLYEDDPNAAFGGEKFVWDSAVHVAFEGGPRWVLHLGGFSFTPYDYRRAIRRSAVPLGPVFSEVGVDHPAARPGKAAVHVPPGASEAVLFTGEAGGSGLWRAFVGMDGSLSSFESLPELPAGTGNERGDLFVAGRALFAVRGSAVFRAIVAGDGSLGAWEAMPSLPEDQIDVHWGDGHGEGAAWGRIGDAIYLTGPRTVFHSVLQPGGC
ncbi:hypothetical protein [Paraliomyxa miuraensis]|uniref:hypothetical protein n=1 Tax=Paraliomyxa miuraensis TaxID=376150 RepID=UPI0022567EC1|nr:hypothetical protein [Paraliomyxa miuraensis]MCX4247930.1 hypothetical protein [Paraliomyxa miuraensis]